MLLFKVQTWTLECYNQYLLYTAWTRVKSNDDMIGCAATVSISTLCSRCYVLTSTSCIITCLHHVLWILSSWAPIIYRVDTVLYLYTLPIASTLIPFVKIAEGGLNFYFSFSFLFYFPFSIYFLFLELGLGLSDKDHAVTWHVTSDDMVTSHMTQRRT